MNNAGGENFDGVGEGEIDSGSRGGDGRRRAIINNMTTETERESYKRRAAEEAVEFVESGMIVGLGTGSTAVFAVRRIARRLRDGELKGVVGCATSRATREEAERLEIPLMSDDMPRTIDLTIDGADEVDPAMNLIKGGGGALLREKIVAEASRRVVIVVDEGKLSPALGTRHALPVEVLPFAWRSHVSFIESLGARVGVRTNADDSAFATDSGNMILDCDFGPIENPRRLAESLARHAGILEHGLFINVATDLIVAGADGISRRAREETTSG